MRRRAKVDLNHKEVVDAFRKAGWLVISLAKLGDGVPDLLISRHGVMRLVEVKAAKGKLTPDQESFMKQGWHFDVIRDVSDVLFLTRALTQ